MKAQTRLIRISRTFKEAKQAMRWDADRKCYLDPNGNIAVDPDSFIVDLFIQQFAEQEEANQRLWWGGETEKVETDKKEKEKDETSKYVLVIQEENIMAEIKVKTREEILSEKTYRERNIAWNRMDEMQEEYESAVINKRWDKKRECYVNRNGEPVVPKKDIIFEDILLEIPRSIEYYTNIGKDKTYVKKVEKHLRDVMISSLRKMDEERMKKSVDEMVNDLKNVAEEVKVEEVKVVENEKIAEEENVEEKVVEKEAVTEEQHVEEAEENLESSGEVKSDAGAGDEKKKDADQLEVAVNTEVPITEVNSDSETQIKIVEQFKKCMETV
ncbi:ring-infected erythrocyte surface antigen-like [Helianthus annuus]|uniref:ring-infected erythrocyte surface antigen-like n=1 Tax=Helianthus annuus TaxID=4232 RepID=UPI001652D33D|nr:ring-infected erythrocyte surface antigen-like [Helianthus annuus]